MFTTLISVVLAGVIYFYTPNISFSDVDQNNFRKLGFPFEAYENEHLSEEESNYRTRLVSVNIKIITVLFPSLPAAAPTFSMGLFPPPKAAIERVQPSLYKQNSL